MLNAPFLGSSVKLMARRAIMLPPTAFAVVAGEVVIDRILQSGAFRTFSQLDQRIRRLEMGGSYQDTVSAKALRDRALTDIGSALSPARRVLGQEALLTHNPFTRSTQGLYGHPSQSHGQRSSPVLRNPFRI
jgi:hypothetical protein